MIAQMDISKEACLLDGQSARYYCRKIEDLRWNERMMGLYGGIDDRIDFMLKALETKMRKRKRGTFRVRKYHAYSGRV